MAASMLPQEVTDHLEAALRISNRRLHLRFLEEAAVLIEFNLPTAAVLVAGAVLELVLAGNREQGAPEERRQIEKWLDLRNGVVHAHVPAITLDQAKEMVQGVRRLLTQDIQIGPRVTATIPAEPLRQLRGKYKWVPTSSTEFIRRKADELLSEHDERRL